MSLHEQALKQWAAQELKVGPEATRDEIRAAYLRALPDDLVPADDWAGPLFVLRGMENSILARTMIEADVRNRIEEFARNLFLFLPVERKATFECLSRIAEPYPNLSARLNVLRPLLKITEEDLQGIPAQLDSAWKFVCSLATAEPSASRSMRQQLLMSMDCLKRKEFHSLARHLRRKHPEVVRAFITPLTVPILAPPNPGYAITDAIYFLMQEVAIATAVTLLLLPFTLSNYSRGLAVVLSIILGIAGMFMSRFFVLDLRSANRSLLEQNSFIQRLVLAAIISLLLFILLFSLRR